MGDESVRRANAIFQHVIPLVILHKAGIFYYYYEINSEATTTDSWAREPFAHHKEDQGTILRSLSGAKRAGAWPTWGCWWTRWSLGSVFLRCSGMEVREVLGLPGCLLQVCSQLLRLLPAVLHTVL